MEDDCGKERHEKACKIQAIGIYTGVNKRGACI